MEITKNTHSYNERRYGRPWIAKIKITPEKPGGEFVWGTWIGDHHHGGEGELSLSNLEAGDIYAIGQKDNRNPRNSAPNFYVLDVSGNSIHCSSIVAAKKTSVEIKKLNNVEVAKNEYTI